MTTQPVTREGKAVKRRKVYRRLAITEEGVEMREWSTPARKRLAPAYRAHVPPKEAGR